MMHLTPEFPNGTSLNFCKETKDDYYWRTMRRRPRLRRQALLRCLDTEDDRDDTALGMAGEQNKTRSSLTSSYLNSNLVEPCVEGLDYDEEHFFRRDDGEDDHDHTALDMDLDEKRTQLSLGNQESPS
mmetsp:Transcript_14356/g.46853  ORF Transcript_14356/g.46853 Transcript_14356/m.46853 type:complete len:128 (+) Transcript_14356:276-659(+)